RGPLTIARESASIFTDGEASERSADCALFQKDPSMKLILTVLGILLLSMAGIYFLMPADQLPAFFPGHNDDVTRLHTKHGIAAGVAGLGAIAGSIWGGGGGGARAPPSSQEA